MEYEDDPFNIMTCCVDRPSREWELVDDDDTCINSEPRLSISDLDSIKSHMLLISYHPYRKIILGVLGQSLWANLFVTY
jgi:hypothetical protein